MKEKDLFIDFEAQQSVYYVEKEDSSYGPILSGSHLSANYLDDFWLKKRNLESKLREQMVNNEITPVYYYMTLQELGIKDLAARVGMSTRKLEKCFKPEYFKKLDLEKLQQFADVFNIPFNNLIGSYLIKEEDREKIEMQTAETKNKFFSITKISIKNNG